MKEHIDILLLLDYAQDKISDETQHDHVTDHLCECEFCRQILKSHYYLIQNHEILIEKFFPVRQTGFQFSPARLIQSISDKIQALKEHGDFISQEIKAEVLLLLDEIKSIPNLEESLVPLKVEKITLLGVEENKKTKGEELKYLSNNIKLRFLPFQPFQIEDFAYRFTGKFFYVSYNKKNFKVLKDRKVNLITGIGSPFVFTSTFKESHNSVNARFKIEFEEILPVEDSTASKENYHEFFLNIDE